MCGSEKSVTCVNRICHDTQGSTLPGKSTNGTLALKKHDNNVATLNDLSSSIINRHPSHGMQASVETVCPVRRMENIMSPTADVKDMILILSLKPLFRVI